MENEFNLNSSLIVFKTDSSINLNAENEEENIIIEEISNKVINTIKNKNVKKVNSNINLTPKRKSKNNIKKYINLYVDYLKLINKNQKTINSYIKKYDVLIDYFNHIKIFDLQGINKKHCKDLQLYLLNFPSNYKKFEELKDKNIFELIDKKDKILNKYERLNKRTVDNYMIRYKTLFNYFLENDYIYTNHFLSIKNLKPNTQNPLTIFKSQENIRVQFEIEEIQKLLNNISIKEIKNIIVISIISGLRINEILSLKVEDIIKIENNYLLDVKKSKTPSGIRKVPISREFNFLIEESIKNKNDDEYIFYNELDGNRLDKIQKRIMRQIRKYIKDKNKVFHSFRKNFTQELYKNDIEELYIKLLLGHSLNNNLSFNTYNLSKINNDTLISVINKIDFKYIFKNTEYYKNNLSKQKEKIQNLNENLYNQELYNF